MLEKGSRDLPGGKEFSIRDVLDSRVLPDTMESQNDRDRKGLKSLLASDYVSALALSGDGEAMILERPINGSAMASWHVVGGAIEIGEDPMTAAERTLLETTGYSSDQWLYLGSYADAEAEQRCGVGHFFCACDAQQVAVPLLDSGGSTKLRWVSQSDLKRALLDGRVHVLSYAITISMVLLTVLE